MTRNLGWVRTALICLLLAVVPAAAVSAQGFLPADVNQDNTVNVVDVQLTVNIILAVVPPPYAGAGDVNGDTSVNVIDVQAVVNWILNPPSSPQITGSPFPQAIVGQHWSYTPTVTGSPAPTLTLGTGAPNWITLLNGTLSGTPAQADLGNHSFTLTASNGAPPDAVQQISINVVMPPPMAPTITGTPPATVNSGSLWTYTPTVTGNPTPTLSLAQGAPSWVSVVGNLVYGTPTNAHLGTNQFVIMATNGVSPDAGQTVNVTVLGTPVAPGISGTPPASVEAGSLWTYTPTVTGFPTPLLSLAAGAPGWVSIAAGTVSGTPAVGDVGVNTFTIVASNGVNPNATQLINVTVTSPPVSQDPVWTATGQTGAPTARQFSTAVWSGTEMIVFGGGASTSNPTATGAKYNPTTDTWTATATFAAPDARTKHTAVWASGRMVVWGGLGPPITINPTLELNSGGMYTPGTDTWGRTSGIGAPSARHSHSAVWTGTQMIVWGGTAANTPTNTGGVWDAIANTWTATSTVGAPGPRYSHTAVWTGSVMIVWGGYGTGIVGPESSGGIYNPTTNSWSPISTVNAPVGRAEHTAVWTGSRMILWGGSGVGGVLGDGASYDPVSNTWTALPATGAPTARVQHSAVWAGDRMIIWGGQGTASVSGLNTGASYNPTTNTWTALPTTNAPSGRFVHTAVWATPGNRMIVWGGNLGSTVTDTGGRLTYP